MNLELRKVYEWTNANQITVNPEKSHLLIIPPKSTHQIRSVKVYMYKSPLKVKDSVKYLGVTIDSRLNFDDHINLLRGKISRSIGVLSKIRHVLPVEALQNLYYSLIHPHLLYGIIIWGNTYKTYLKRLTTLQNRAVKISVGAHWRDNTANCFVQLQVLKLTELFTHEVAKFMYKYTSKNLPPSFSFFTSVASVHIRSTRLASSQYSLYLPRYKTLTLQRNIKFQGVKIWNSVPLEIKKLSFNRFKIQYKHLLSNYT